MAKRLILRADDAGGCVSANEAISEALEAGVLRNVSIMAPGFALDHAARTLAKRDACFGMHLCLNAEWETVKWGPVAPNVPSLVEPDGFFSDTPNRLKEKEFDIREVEIEMEAQLERLRTAGFKIAYLDQHMGVGWIGLQDLIAAFCTRHALIDAERMVSAHIHWEGEATVERVVEATERSPDDPTRYILHPGKIAPDMNLYVRENLKPGEVARGRDAERRLLTDPALRAAMEAGRFQSVRYDEVAA